LILEFFLANIICTIGTLLQIHSVIKDRNRLGGYGFWGSFLTLVALWFMFFGFHKIGDETNAWILLITITYWVLVVVFTVKTWWKKHE